MSKGKKKKPSRRIYTDRDGYPVDRDGNRINIEENGTPMYRAYGKHRVYRPWVESIGDILYKILVLAVTIPMYSVAVGAVIALFYYMRIYPSLGIIGFSLIIYVAVRFYIKGLRMIRKRVGYYSRLKRFCRKKGYRIEIKRNRFLSLIPTKKPSIDAIIYADGIVYYIQFIGARHKLSEMTFFDDGRVTYLSLEEKKGISYMLGLKNKEKTGRICFPDGIGGEGIIKAVVTCPDPKKTYRNIGGSLLPFGSRDRVSGFKVFSTDGLIYAIEHDREKI